MATTLLIKARIEEVPTIGQFTIDAYLRDKEDFAAYKSTKYTDGFLDALILKQKAVDEIVNPVVLTGELKAISLKLANTILGLRTTMNLLEGYVADAIDLTVAPKDFGIREVRKKVTSGDVEGLNGALATLLTNITKNMTALINAGYTDAAKTALSDTKKAIFDMNASQNKKENERAELVVNNMITINDFCKDIKAIWDDGKRQYKTTDKLKLKDYTNSALIARIRNEQLKTLIIGFVINKLGKKEIDAKIVARPSVTGKRGLTVKSDSTGAYELKGLIPTTYLITVTLQSGESYAVNGDAKTNETTNLNLVQPA